jgi:hypothetical protein
MSEQPSGALGSGDPGRGIVAPATDPQALKTTRYRPAFHRAADFRCAKSPRVQGFLTGDYQRFAKTNYCKALILPNPDDETGIWGYYTLSPYKIEPQELSRKQRGAFRGSLPIPMILVGFMGKDDSAPPRLGEALLVVTARRVYRSDDTAAASLILESEGGPGTRLYEWYGDTMKFEPIRRPDPNKKKSMIETGVLFCPLASLIPEEWPGN